MLYYNSKDFINDLKNYNTWKVRAKGQLKLLDKLNYLKYEKIKSPMDYDIIGYDGKEPIRAIKHSAPPTSEQIYDAQERLDKEIRRVTNLLNRCNEIINKVNKQLNALPEDVRKACVEIYIKGNSYDVVAREMNVSYATLFRSVKKTLSELDKPFNEK